MSCIIERGFARHLTVHLGGFSVGNRGGLPSRSSRRQSAYAPRGFGATAGEGNRTLVFSLEGYADLNKINGGSEESLLNCQTYTRLFDQWDAGLRDDVTKFLDLVDLKFLGLVQRQ